MAAVENFFSKNEVFLSDFSVNKSSKNQNLYIILGTTEVIRVPNIYINVYFVMTGPVVLEKRSTQHEKSGFEKNAFKVFFHEKSSKKLYLQLISDAGTI